MEAAFPGPAVELRGEGCLLVCRFESARSIGLEIKRRVDPGLSFQPGDAQGKLSRSLSELST